MPGILRVLVSKVCLRSFAFIPTHFGSGYKCKYYTGLFSSYACTVRDLYIQFIIYSPSRSLPTPVFLRPGTFQSWRLRVPQMHTLRWVVYK